MKLLQSLFFGAMFLPFYAHAQQIENVKLTQRIADVEQQQLLQVLPLFQLIDATVHQPIDLSADNGLEKLKTAKLVLPKDINNGIHAYGFVYHQHLSGLFPNHTLILVERAANLQSMKSRVWVDKDNDLDLSNDSAYTFNPNQTLVLPIDNNPLGYAVELSNFQKTQIKSIQSLYESAISMIKQDRVFFGVNHSFREKRMNTWVGMQLIGKDTIYWGLKDINSNGAFNDVGTDLIVTANSINRFELENAKPYMPGQQLVWLGRRFQFLGFDPASQQIQLRIMRGRITRKQKRESKSLLIGQKMPRFRFCKIVEKKAVKPRLEKQETYRQKEELTKPSKKVTDGAKKRRLLRENHKKVNRAAFYSLKKQKGVSTLVVIWNAFDNQWNQDSMLYHELARVKNDSFQVVMLNYGGSGRYVYRYNKTYDIFAHQGFLTSSLIALLKVQTMPQSILLDDKFRIIEMNPDLEALLKTEKSRKVRPISEVLPF